MQRGPQDAPCSSVFRRGPIRLRGQNLIQYRRAPEACGLLVSNPQIAAAATVTDVIILLLREILL
jgi:hypothetical protein